MWACSTWAPALAILRGMPMDMSFTDEQTALVDTVRDFAKKEIIPVAGKLDEDGTFPQAMLKKAWELGLLNAEVPEAYGGLGLSCLDHCLIQEEVAYGCAGVNTTVAGNMLAAMAR